MLVGCKNLDFFFAATKKKQASRWHEINIENEHIKKKRISSYIFVWLITAVLQRLRCNSCLGISTHFCHFIQAVLHVSSQAMTMKVMVTLSASKALTLFKVLLTNYTWLPRDVTFSEAFFGKLKNIKKTTNKIHSYCVQYLTRLFSICLLYPQSHLIYSIYKTIQMKDNIRRI